MKTPKYLVGLNPRQRYAATALVPSLAIVAGPGTGKTRTIASRIVNLVEALGVHPSRIVAFTFTRSAAAELRERVEKMGGPDLALVNVTTFHAYALRIVRSDPGAVQAPSVFTIAGNGDVDAVTESLWDGPLKRPEAAKVGRQTFARSLVDLYARGVMPEGRSGQVMVSTFLGRLADLGLVPAGMLLPMAAKVLERSEAAREVAAETTHVLVDEAHDASPLEWALVRTLSAGEPRGPGRLSVVLDPRQAIFGWRGALGGKILDGFALPGNVEEEVVELSTTYRFGKRIAAVADRVAELAAPGLEPLRVDEAIADAVTAVAWTTAEDHLRDLVKTYGATNVAVLVRSRREAVECSIAFRDLVDNVHEEDGLPSWIRTAVAVSSLVVNPADNAAFRRLYEAEERYLAGRPPFERWASRVGRSRSLVAEYLGTLAVDEAGEQGSLLWEATRAEADVLTFDDAARLGVAYDHRNREEPTEAEVEATIRPTLDALAVSGLGLADALDRLSLRSDSDGFAAIRERGRTPVSTIHAAKGREWDAVLVVTGDWPWRVTKSGAKAEEWRTLYVALTRARRDLVVASHPESDTSGVLS